MRSHKSSSKNDLVKKPLCITNYLHWSIRPKSKKEKQKLLSKERSQKPVFIFVLILEQKIQKILAAIDIQLFTRQINETGAFTIDIAFGIIKDIKQYLSTNIKNSTKENKFHEKTVRKIKREDDMTGMNISTKTISACVHIKLPRHLTGVSALFS